MYLGFEDMLWLIHPTIAVIVVFPLLGMVVRMAWQTRQRHWETRVESKSKIPALVGPEHLKLGRWLTVAVVGIELLGITCPLLDHILTKQIWSSQPIKVISIALLYVVTISSLVLLLRAYPKRWRAIFASLTGIGIVILSLQDGIYRRNEEWYASHLYFGVAVTLLMVFSLAIVPDIYQDRSQRWRKLHVLLNCIALLLFMGQGMTGTRDLLEIPLSWQKQYIYQCDYLHKKCPTPPKQSRMNGIAFLAQTSEVASSGLA